MAKSYEVGAIYPGYPYEIRFQFPQAFWDAEQMASGRLVSQFRVTPTQVVLTQADTLNGTLQREADYTLAFLLSGDMTDRMISVTKVEFDIARLDGADERLIPLKFILPVNLSVTRDA